MRNITNILLYIVLITTVIIVLGCTGANINDDQIVGNWNTTYLSYNSLVTFEPNGIVNIYTNDGGTSDNWTLVRSANWSRVTDNTTQYNCNTMDILKPII